jgi:hypothetical protein
MKTLATAATLAACLASSSALAGPSACDATYGNNVANCGFETGDFTGWTLTGSAFELAQTNNYGIDSYDPNSGTYDAFFANQGPVLGTASAAGDITLSQTLGLEVGRSYTVSFDLAQDTPVATGYTNFFSATFDAATLLSETAAPATGTGGVDYVAYSYTVTALGADTLAFAFQNDAGDWFLDDVTVTQIPEPATVGVFASALLGLALVARPRKARKVLS